jgi:RNA polymerase sigma-70 factor (ECF subfamily)
MLSFQKGDREAFTHLYRKYKKPVYSFLVRQYVTPENAAELTQEIFLRAVQGASSFRHGAKFSTWLFVITRNSAIDFLRKNKHRNHASLDEKSRPEARALNEKIATNRPAPDRESMATRLKKDLEQAIRSLPEEQREVFLLREYHGLRFDEIAQIVQSSSGTVKSRMRYALETLRRRLSDYSDYARTLL